MTTHITCRRRAGVALAAALVGGLALVAVPTPASAGPIAGETTSISGTVPGKVARTVTLQKYQSKSWRSVKKARSSSKGRYAFALETPTSATTYRVHAPKVRIKRKTYKAWKSSSRKVSPTSQTGELAVPARVRKGQAFTAQATFWPARASRPVVLQAFRSGTWTTLASGKQGSTGAASLVAKATDAGPLKLRAVTSAYRGARAAAGPVRTVTVEDRTILLSRGRDGLPGDLASATPSLSRDGRWEAFESAARNLVPEETTHFQIYLRDRTTGKIKLISRTAAGVASDGYNYEPRISADGSAIVWSSEARNIEDYDGNRDIFRWTRADDKIERISQPVGGSANNHSWAPSISDDGDVVAYLSKATNLVGNVTDTNLRDDVFVWSEGHGTEIASFRKDTRITGNDAATRPSISGDGQVVAFGSTSSDLVADDTNRVEDVFVLDRGFHTFRMLTRGVQGGAANGESSQPVLDEDGSTIAFTSRAGNLTDPATTGFSRLTVWTQDDGAFRAYNGTRFGSTISSDGTRIAFTSGESQLPTDMNGEPDAYLLDLRTGITSLVSVSPSGIASNGRSEHATISGDGQRVAFTSTGSTVLDEEPRGVSQVYARDMG